MSCAAFDYIQHSHVCVPKRILNNPFREANSESSREVIIPWARLSLHIARCNDHQNPSLCRVLYLVFYPPLSREIVMNNNETWRDFSSCCSNIALLLSGLENTLLSQFQVYFSRTEYSVSSLLTFYNVLLFKIKVYRRRENILSSISFDIERRCKISHCDFSSQICRIMFGYERRQFVRISCEHKTRRLHNQVTGVCRPWPLLAAIRANKLNFDA